jgi:hypothetical protein
MGISSIMLGLPYDNWQVRNLSAVDPNAVQRHVGHYKSGKFKMEIKMIANELYAVISGQTEIKLFAESDNKYYFKDFNTTLNFTENLLTIHEHGRDSQWIKSR